jgi:hypothetical protein
MSDKVVQSVVFYPVTPRTEEDDPHEVDTPVCINLTRRATERLYEEVCDGYMTLTEEEFQQMRRALNKAHKERKPA